MKKSLYIVDMIRDVVQKVNESFAGKFSDIEPGVIPSDDGIFRLNGYAEEYTPFEGLLVKNGDIIELRDGIFRLANVVNYNYGHPIEIASTLLELSKSELTSNMRYPILALITDFAEKKDSTDYYCKVNLNFIIATLTDKNYKSEERTEKSFKSVLHPIYEEFLNQLKRSKHFLIQYDQNIPHTKVDRYFWGRNSTYDKEIWKNIGVDNTTGNIFNDYVDVVEILGLELKVDNKFKQRNNLIK